MNFLDIIFPKRCLNCGRLGKYFCERCSSIIRIIELNEAICPVCEKPAIDGRTHPGCQTRYSLDGLTSFFRYDGIIRKAVKAIKYRYISDLAQEFISLVPGFWFSELTKFRTNESAFIPIPLHPTRLRFRGFNQAELLAGILAKRLHIPIQKNLLKRIKYTVPQVEMKERDKRLKNMEHVFSAQSFTMNDKPLTIFLFDDVFTTGATLRSAANVLKRAGVRRVWGITMAR